MACREAARERPNIVFFIADDQRFDTIRALGHEQVITPTMDALVERGISFTHACHMGSTMPAVCLPSRAMLMSGRTLYHVPGDLQGTLTFPMLLREHGYTTFATGKWHNERAFFNDSFADGAKLIFGGMSDHLAVPVYDYDPEGGYPKEKQYIADGFSTDVFTDEAVRFLEQYEAEAPFLLYVAYTAPHDPRMAPQEYEDLYPRDRVPVPPNFMPEHPFDNGEMRIRYELLAPFPRTPEIVQEHLGAYWAMLTHMDEHMGRVVQALEATGRAHNTIIIHTADHGLAVGQHGLLGKQNMYEHSIRVPLLISGPGIPRNERRDCLCYQLDLFPTLCDLLGLPVPPSVESSSLMPVIRGEAARVRANQFHAYMDVQRAVRDERWKLIEYCVEGTRRTQLFDLEDDPWEMSDLAGDAQGAPEVERLRGELARWQRELDDLREW